MIAAPLIDDFCGLITFSSNYIMLVHQLFCGHVLEFNNFIELMSNNRWNMSKVRLDAKGRVHIYVYKTGNIYIFLQLNMCDLLGLNMYWNDLQSKLNYRAQEKINEHNTHYTRIIIIIRIIRADCRAGGV